MKNPGITNYFTNIYGRFSILLLAGILISSGCHGKEEEKKTEPEVSLQKEEVVRPQYDRYWNDVSRYLAGMPVEPGSRIEDFASSRQAQKQIEFFRNSWEPIEDSRLTPMRDWRAKELGEIHPEGKFVFYPFGGPDFLHVSTFFPGASDYVQFGLEPPGLPPDVRNMNQEERDNLLYLTRTSLHSVLKFSFFRTNDMKRDLIQSQMGAGPILMAFAVRNGYTVLDAKSVHINAQGQEMEGQANASQIPGIRIIVQKGEDGPVSNIHYYSLDISNSAEASNSPFFRFMEAQSPFVSYTKGASYLMHREGFSNIRDLILNHSRAYLQDDSGIPLHNFDSKIWDLTFYGSFTGPIQLFRARDQQDLRKAYRSPGVKNLPFGIGYVYQKGKSNLMLALKKDRSVPGEVPASGNE